MKTLEEILAFNIEWRMTALGMTQKELAKKAKTTDQAINRYLNGKQFPRRSFLINLAKALNCTKEDLFGLTSALKMPQDILEAITKADSVRLQDIRLLLRIPIPEQAQEGAKKKP